MRRLSAATLALLLLAGCGADRLGPPGSDVVLPDVPPEVVADVAHEVDMVDAATPDLLVDVSLDGELPPDVLPVDVSEWVNMGKYWLANGEPAFAQNEFELALEWSPNDQEALFGAGLASFVRAVELFAMVLTLPNQAAAYAAGEGTPRPTPPGPPESENDFLVEEVHTMLLGLRTSFLDAEHYLGQIEAEDFAWHIEQVPIFVYTRRVVNLRGTFDLGDRYLLSSANAFFLWATELMAAQDLHTDLLAAAYTALKLADEPLDVFSVLDLAGRLMASDPRFLSLTQEDGPELYEAGSRHMREVGQFLLLGLEHQSNDPEDPAGHAVALIYEKGEPTLVLNRVDFGDQVELETRILFTQDLLFQFEDLLARMQMPGEFVPFAEGAALQLGTMLGFFTRLDLLRFFPVEIPIDLGNLQPAQVVSLLTLFLGNSIGLDYATLFENPIGLRALLPLMVKTGEPQGPQDFWMEWECPEETAQTGLPQGKAGFICSGDAVLTDSPHFAGTPHEIPADGLDSPLPYFVWEDPTWGGALGVDALYLDNAGDPASFVTPDLQLTNLGIHLWLSPILSLLN